MAESEKSQKLVETNKAVAAGIASVITAVFTSKLGVAGTMIGTALAATMITLTSAILKAQLEKASNTIVGLPGAVQGRLSTQQIRIPGKPSAEPNPEPAAQLEAEEGRKKSPGLLSRLRAVPGFFKELPSVQRRKILIAGLLAGLVATMIGLIAVTGIEIVGGNTLSCLVWTCPEDDTASGESSSRGSGLSILGGRSFSSTQGTDTQGIPPVDDPSGKQQFAPEEGQQAPQQRQPDGQPAQPGVDEEVLQQQPGEAPRGADPGQQPDVEPEPEEKNDEPKNDEAEPPPADQQSPPPRGEVGNLNGGTQKEDRG